MVLPYVWILDASDAPWTLQTLQNLALARLWALGSVRDCGRSCADCGLGALARQILFFSWPETALQTPQTPQTPQTLRHLPMVLPYSWILDASDAPWTLQTLQNLALARLWALGSVRDCGRSCADCGLGALARQIFFSSGPKLPFKPLKRFDTCQWFCHTSGFWTLQTLHGRFRRSKTSHLLDCVLWALCETVGGVAQTVGSGLWRAKSFFSSGPKLPFKPLKPLKPLKRFDTCQWFCHTSGFWTLQTLHGRFRRSKTSHLLDCGLWALCETAGGVAQTVGSGLWRAKSFFSSGPKLPFKPLKPLKRFDTCQWFCHTSGFWTLQTLHGRFRRSKTSQWALGSVRDCGRSCADCGLGALWPEIALKPLKPLKRFDTCQWFCHTSGFSTLQTLQNLALARLWALGSVRDCGRSCAACGLQALARQILFF